MGPRRRNKSNARSEAIKAARKKDNSGEESPDAKVSASDTTTAVPNMPGFLMPNTHQEVKMTPSSSNFQCQPCDMNSSDNNGSDLIGNGDPECCLHCHKKQKDIQVRCDECQSFICCSCHWCHEYQANHEIRVCDRCDAFYCRNCDEMDQCDDCGEVVCASCSTLLSCKFCGGGLCEECATACGRCGIVLCSRDAKFAVDCDTCRLSYCLVCLASGSKDPCVRCGHRPSKRMEQLVHLRLKSIYKAFKQSSRSPKNNPNLVSGMNASDGNGHHSGPTIEELEDGMDTDFFGPDGPYAASYNSSTYPSPPWEDDNPIIAATTHASQKVLAEKFWEEKQKEADAAAEALLAELDEEEEAAKTKKSKKKKKKARQQKAKQKEEEEQQRKKGGDEPESKGANNTKDTVDTHETENEKDVEKETTPKASLSISTNEDSVFAGAAVSEDDEPNTPQMDPIEKRLLDCVESSDVDGIEGILFELKGVPGRASLRKNAKKALKKLRAPATVPTAMAVDPAPAAPVMAPVPTSKAPPSALNSKPAAKTKASTQSQQHSGPPVPIDLIKVISENKGKHPNRMECLMHMSPVVVGWVIGKGGQRIRDLMEESGAKVWIDQEKAKPDEPRNVYISGEKASVDTAVRMVREIVSKAPIEGASKYAPTPPLKPTPAPATTDNPQEAVANVATNKQTPVGTVAKPSEAAAAAATAAKLESMPTSMPAMKLPPTAASEVLPSVNIPLPPTAEAPAISIPADSNAVHHVMTCEARFVPLLIGKRGWAIKDIQDKSGARVDIDQTVTPRQIRISGSKDCVEKAIPMVRDVLNYPHAQPQPGIDLGTEADLAPLSKVEVPPAQDDRPHSPLPSTYITTSDAKSMISASSSLSSTPEPSMASNQMKVFPQHAGNSPLLPPPDYAPNGAGNHLPSPSLARLPQDRANGMVHMGDRNAYPPRQVSPHEVTGGLLGMQQMRGVGIPHHPEHMYNHIPEHTPLAHDTARGHVGIGGGFRSQDPKNGMSGTQTGLNYGLVNQTAHGNPGAAPMQQQHMAPQANSLGQFNSMASNGPMPGSNLGAAPGFDTRLGSNPVPAAPGLWNQGTAPNAMSQNAGLGQLSGGSAGLHHGASAQAGFLQSLRQTLNGGGMGHAPAGNPLPAGLGLGQPNAGVKSSNGPDSNFGSFRDDSNIIDSLFGPSNGTSAAPRSAPGTDGQGQGLLPPNMGGPTSGGGLWGTSMAEWNATQSQSMQSNNVPKSEEPGLDPSFLAGLPGLSLSESRPAQSRFDWGSNNA